ncbi:MAG: low temperature requirement protein A [Actinomycetota bacterium]
MTGRDPHESHRAATPLELLFDLTFVVAFGIAAGQLAHLLAAGHVAAGLAAFFFAMFAVSWAWINFSWFASAFDTDDWVYRVTTMVQMVGVIVLALGIPQMYSSIEHGEHVDNAVVVAGYVVMRVAMVTQWLRAAGQDPERRKACLTYALWITLAQVGWIVAIFVHTSLAVTGVVVVGLVLVEMMGPVLAESTRGGTPWHAHHIAERYGLFTIIALGEGVVGTVASLTAVVEAQGWSFDAAFVAVAGIGLTFGMWWTYFALPQAEILHVRRERAFWFGYLHIVVFAAIVATGAGLHAAAYYLEHHSELGSVATVLTVVVPVGIYLLMIYVLWAVLTRTVAVFHAAVMLATAVVLVAAVVLAARGVSMANCLLVVTVAPIVAVVAHELRGHRHTDAAVARAVSR